MKRVVAKSPVFGMPFGMKKKEYTDVDFEMFVMPFGVHQGTILAELPASYILWIMNEDYCPPVLKAWGELHEEDLQERASEEEDDFYDGYY